jgi:hypothetical protein
VEQNQPNSGGMGQGWSAPPQQGNWGPTPPPIRQGPTFGDFLNFRWMITPSLIVVIWVIGAVLITLYSLTLLTPRYSIYYSSSGGVLEAVLFFVFGQLWFRVFLEFIAVLFRINDKLGSIDRKTPDQRG